VTNQDTQVPRLLVVVALLAAAAVSRPVTNAVYSDATSNTGNGIQAISCAGTQMFGNPGFEAGTPAPWVATYADEITSAGPPPRTGTWNAVLDVENNDTRKSLAQTVSIPRYCAAATFSFWLRVQTFIAPGSSNLYLRILAPARNTVLATLATFPPTNTADYQRYTYNLTAYRGQTVVVRFDGVATGTRRTIYVIDDTSLTLTR
jgi:hypothetical protein